jgi:TPR repeat protein
MKKAQKALEYFNSAASAGHIDAKTDLGLFNEHGWKVEE